MTAVDLVSGLLLGAGTFFFLAGTAGLLRFPDVYCRLHALTKADNLGLGLVLAGLMLRSGSWMVAAKLGVIWVLVLLASTTACHLVARTAFEHDVEPWRRS
jgi:multicomponent Na+:H+ antiporter subunit G